MKKLIPLSFIVICFTIYGSIARAASEKELISALVESFEYAGKYALTEMRPTASFRSASVLRARVDGSRIKGRVSTNWVTAFTGKYRNTVIDVWLKENNGSVYLVHYTLYSDDHNIPIANPQDRELRLRLGSSLVKKDDF